MVTSILHHTVTHICGYLHPTPYRYACLIATKSQQKLPHKTINNLTTDWNDGILIAALVDAHAPGLCPEADTMDPQNGLENASHSMKLAEDWLGVPQVSSVTTMSMYGHFPVESEGEEVLLLWNAVS